MVEPKKPEAQLHAQSVLSIVGTPPAACTQNRRAKRQNGDRDLPVGVEVRTGPCARLVRQALPTGACSRVSCSEEPGAGKLPAGIREGGAGQPASLPRQAADKGG